MPAKTDPPSGEPHLTRRERQLMDVVHRRREATAREIMAELPDPPGYSTVRTLLSLLVKKGHLRCLTTNRTHIYRPVRQRSTAAAAALRRLVSTFFDGSVSNAMCGLLSLADHRLTPEESARLANLIAESKTKKGEAP